MKNAVKVNTKKIVSGKATPKGVVKKSAPAKKKSAPKKVSRRGAADKRALIIRRALQQRLDLTGKLKQLQLEKFEKNPIVEPRSHVNWESKATFNPAAVRVGGKVHVLYRAIGDSDMSVLG